MYTIVFSDNAARQIRKLEKTDQVRVIAVLERVRVRPERFVTRLVGESAYRLRVGYYRVILDIDKGKLVVVVINNTHISKKFEHKR